MGFTAPKALVKTGFFLSCLFLWGCSSSIFDSAIKDKRIVELTQNNQFAVKCRGMRLESLTLNVPTARQLIACLNENGSIEELEEFSKALTDEQLEVFLEVINRGVLTNKNRLKKFDLTFQLLNKSGLMDQVMEKMADVVSNKKFVNSAIKLLHALSFQSVNGKESIDPELIKILVSLAPYIQRDTLAHGLDLAEKASALKSFLSLSKTFSIQKKTKEPSLKSLSEQLTTYLFKRAHDTDFLGDILLSTLQNKSFFQGFDHYLDFFGHRFEEYPNNPNYLNIDSQLASLNLFLKLSTGFSGNDPELLEKTSALFRALNGPIECLADGKKISNALYWVLSEVSSPLRSSEEIPAFFGRTQLTALSLTNGICAYPSDIQNNISALTTLSESGGSYVAGNLIKSFSKADAEFTQKKLISLLVGFIQDQNISGLKDTLKVLTERGILMDGLYLFNALDQNQDRQRLADVANALLEEKPVLDQRSIYKVLVQRLQKIQLSQSMLNSFSDVIIDFSGYFDKEKYPAPILNPSLSLLRKVLLKSNVNPVVELVQEIAQDGEKDRRFFETLFHSSTIPQFQGVLELTVRMSRDGSLNELLAFIFSLFRNFVEDENVNHIIAASVAPVPTVSELMDRSKEQLLPESELNVKKFVSDTDQNSLSCSTLDLRIGLDDTGHSGWEKQVRSLSACIDGMTSQPYDDVVDLIEFGLAKKMPEVSEDHKKNPRSFLAYVVDLMKTFVVQQPVSLKQGLGNFFKDQLEDLKRIVAFNGLLVKRYFIQDVEVSFLENLLLLAPKISEKANHVEKLFHTLADINEKPAFPEAVSYVARKVYEFNAQGYPFQEIKLPTRQEVAKAIEKHEGWGIDPMDMRVNKVYEDFGKLLRNDTPLTEYKSFQDFNTEVWKFIEPLARPAVLEWSLNYYKLFRNNPYSPEWWAGWHRRLATHYTVIPYYYPGEDKPRVRIVNDLDRLEIIVIDADFKMKDYCSPKGAILCVLPGNKENFAIRYLSYLARSKKDLWPAIEAMEKELAFYLSIIDDPFQSWSIPKEVQHHLANLKHTVPVLRELYSGYGTGADKKDGPNDARVLSDMFKTILSGTPPKDRETYDGKKNSLEFIVQLTRLGILRNAGRSLQSVDPWSGDVTVVQDNHLTSILRSLVENNLMTSPKGQVSVNAESLELLNFLFRTPTGKQLVDKVMKFFYDLASEPESRKLMTGSAFALISIFGETLGPKELSERGLNTSQALVRFLLETAKNHPDTLGNGFDALELVFKSPRVLSILEKINLDSREHKGFKSLLELLSSTIIALSKKGMGDSLMILLDHLYLKEPSRSQLANLKTSWNTVLEDPAYEQKNISDMFYRFFNWFDGYGTLSKRDPLAIRTQEYGVHLLRHGDLLNLLLFAGKNDPNEVYLKLSLLGNDERIKDIESFSDFLNRAMQFRQ